MNAVFGFVDEQETVPAINEDQSNAEQTQCPVAQTFQRDRKSLILNLGNNSPTVTVIANYRNTLYLVAEDGL